MTRRQLTWAFRTAVAIYVALFFIGFVVRLLDDTPPYRIYGTYKDMLPLLVASSASWLGFCLQRRMSYIQQLRILWSKVVDAVQAAQQYTHVPEPTRQEHAVVLFKLSVLIDEVRGVFRNLGESPSAIGTYPFEPIKQMYEVALKLGYGRLGSEVREATRTELFDLWRRVRPVLLREFDRQEPTFAVTDTRPKELAAAAAGAGAPVATGSDVATAVPTKSLDPVPPTL